MKHLLAAAIVLTASLSWLSAQERPVPKDSARLSVSGCARGRVFTVDRDPTNEASREQLEYGMKLRMQGDKRVFDQLKANEKSMVEITGIMKTSDTMQGGVGLAGGRVRIAPAMPAGRGPAYDPGPQPPVIDVESWRLLNASCPAR